MEIELLGQGCKCFAKWRDPRQDVPADEEDYCAIEESRRQLSTEICRVTPFRCPGDSGDMDSYSRDEPGHLDGGNPWRRPVNSLLPDSSRSEAHVTATIGVHCTYPEGEAVQMHFPDSSVATKTFEISDLASARSVTGSRSQFAHPPRQAGAKKLRFSAAISFWFPESCKHGRKTHCRQAHGSALDPKGALSLEGCIPSTVNRAPAASAVSTELCHPTAHLGRASSLEGCIPSSVDRFVPTSCPPFAAPKVSASYRDAFCLECAGNLRVGPAHANSEQELGMYLALAELIDPPDLFTVFDQFAGPMKLPKPPAWTQELCVDAALTSTSVTCPTCLEVRSFGLALAADFSQRRPSQ